MPIPELGRRRTALVLAAATAASCLAAATGAAGQDSTTLTFRGGDATDVVDCRNVSQEEVKQINRCRARADGGDAVLENVDITVLSGGGITVNGGTVDVVSVGGGDAQAGVICVNERGEQTKGKQKNICLARAKGGKATFSNVAVVVHRANGTTTTRNRTLVALAGRRPRTHANCLARGSTAADCTAAGNGADVGMRNVEYVNRSTGVTRRGVNVEVSGGDAKALVYCGNSSGSSKIQFNICEARANGGDAVLRDVKIHIFEG